jgi:hypothetical protein
LPVRERITLRRVALGYRKVRRRVGLSMGRRVTLGRRGRIMVVRGNSRVGIMLLRRAGVGVVRLRRAGIGVALLLVGLAREAAVRGVASQLLVCSAVSASQVAACCDPQVL